MSEARAIDTAGGCIDALSGQSASRDASIMPPLARYPTSPHGDEAKAGQTSARVLMNVENAAQVEPVGEFELKVIGRPPTAYNVVAPSLQIKAERRLQS